MILDEAKKVIRIEAEALMAYEAVVRLKPFSRLSIDIAGFYNNYSRLVNVETSAPSGLTPTQPYLLVTNTLRNNERGEDWGTELAIDWRVLDYWRLAGAYSYIYASHAAGLKPPAHQASLRSQWDITNSIEFDLWGRYVDRSEDFMQIPIAGYLTMDARVGWRPIHNLELSLTGRNLLHGMMQEFRPEFLATQPSACGREIYGKVTWR